MVNGTRDVILYAFDAADDVEMEHFLTHYTTEQEPRYSIESKSFYLAEFESFRSMFLAIGGLLSFVVGLVAILNFINAILTVILTRRWELAMLQSIGMTGKQLKTMLVQRGFCMPSPRYPSP